LIESHREDREALRAAKGGKGNDLTQRQADALAGDWYRWFTSHDWRGLHLRRMAQRAADHAENRSTALCARAPRAHAPVPRAVRIEFERHKKSEIE